MGRKIKYTTKKEKQEAQKKWSLEYYYRNAEKCKIKRMERYYARKK
jgi:hypothetical protein